VQSFEPALVVFAGILILSSYKLLAGGDDDEEEDLASQPIFQLCRRVIKTVRCCRRAE